MQVAATDTGSMTGTDTTRNCLGHMHHARATEDERVDPVASHSRPCFGDDSAIGSGRVDFKVEHRHLGVPGSAGPDC
jgi:hypothetical protein